MRKTVLITGCSSGFGKAAALQFRDADWNVVATMTNTGAWSEPGSENVLVLPLDIRDDGSIGAALARAIDHFGRVDCVVNNAGMGLFSVFEATPMETVRALFETNVFGAMRVMQAVLPHFRDNGGGRVVNVSSSSAIVPEPLLSVYSASKWAVDGFTESVRHELATQNIVVKLVEPGLVKETNFVQRALETSQAVPVPPTYRAYADQIAQMYLGPSPFRLSTATDVADAIFTAAADDTDQLRYNVGEDSRTLAHMRRETSEAEYNAWTLARSGAGRSG
jgi:NAD(P)-dependent dehydrogenase (short-subunit alcohol dehydrogenase family)